MSRTPSQQCGHTTPPDRPYVNINSVSRPHHPDPMPVAYHQPYPRHEPRHFLPPELHYERPTLTTPPGPPRLPSLGQLPESSVDPRYMVSSDHGYMNRPLMPQALPLRMHHHSPTVGDPRGYPGPGPSPASYGELSSPMLSHGGDYARHRVRTHDLESQ
ncbi:uncharacterized protein N7482_004598 [Penicillium canariense]|uniref:Uncharacterized protein n=1 Tax=Penicillium canariense TaxID=189055 RepID=A0A9W9I6L8_9EURO|nr:uncharacterized protein N7482_004598 [Penicillium canariense]KAJ5169004.1 hypothetical protein N7482_004598 [Penicillium canariense]